MKGFLFSCALAAWVFVGFGVADGFNDRQKRCAGEPIGLALGATTVALGPFAFAFHAAKHVTDPSSDMCLRARNPKA